MSTSTYRLPAQVTPRRYDIKLDARLGREEFTGQVRLTFDLHTVTDSIALHSRDLAISKAEVKIGEQNYPAKVTDDPNNERIRLHFADPLPAGMGELTLTYAGKVSQTLKGLYLSQNPPEQVICTQCEATEARAIFPCLDEPTFKAQFAFEITTAPDVAVLANGPLLSVTESGSTKTWTFAPTKKMSSYLIALVIGDVAGTPEKIVNNIPLRVWAIRGKEHMGSFALDYTARLLPWYEDYFGVPYHYDKYDQVAVPGFAAGAMENSGLVLFRQEALIMKAGSVSWQQEKSIAHVIAHEFAHMWFGNLVTMQWWDDLWLNEAFAEWMSYRVISDISPEYRLWDDFQRGKNYALTVDSLENTHPIYSPVETPAQAGELFDAITYTKGCAVLRMLENFLGQEAFRAGLRTYMQEFYESNARGADLWRHLQAASKQPVVQIMESWILQSGYPCIQVNLERGGDESRLHVCQQRFFSNPQVTQENAQLWLVPLVIRYADDAGVHVVRHVLELSEELLPLPMTGTLKWCYANAEEIGFYRQNLDADLLAKLLEHIDSLNPSEQMGLLADQWGLTRNGNQDITHFLDVLTALVLKTENYNLLYEIVSNLFFIERIVEDTGSATAMEHFRNWVKDMFEMKLDTLGFEPRSDESAETSQQRISVINAMAALAHHPATVARVRQLAEREAADSKTVDANLATLLVTIDAQFGDAETFKKHVEVYQARKNAGSPPQEVTRYVYSFPAFRGREQVAQTLSLLDEGVAPREALSPMLGRMLNFRHAQIAAWDYIKTNWAMIKEMGMFVSGLIEEAGQLPPSMRADVVEFGEAHVKGVADMAYAKALETIDLEAEFYQRVKDDLLAWLSHQPR